MGLTGHADCVIGHSAGQGSGHHWPSSAMLIVGLLSDRQCSVDNFLHLSSLQYSPLRSILY